jgi:hypothetical protein
VTGLEAVERRQGGGIHGRVAGRVVLLAGRGVAVLPRRSAVRAGEPGAPADHVQRGAHAHQRRPDADAGARRAAAVRAAEDGGFRVRVLDGDEDGHDQDDAVRQRGVHLHDGATMRTFLSFFSPSLSLSPYSIFTLELLLSKGDDCGVHLSLLSTETRTFFRAEIVWTT